MSDILFSQDRGVLSITLDRPKKKNALTFSMYRALAEALRTAGDDVRAILLSANGDTFCAGNDISDFLASGETDFAEAPPHRFVSALVDNDKPIVAAVHGAAIGVGATMLLHCDLVYASETASLAMPFVSLGLVPEAGSSLLLPERVGRAVAAEMLLLGTSIPAARAKDLQLVNAVLPAEGLLAFARDRAHELAAKPPRALRATKALLQGDKTALRRRVAEEGSRFAACLASPEAREAFTAFLERRPPDFSKL